MLAKENRRLFALTGIAVCGIYGVCSTVVAPDLKIFLYPWIDHITSVGAVKAFAAPFANYTPPYLYLLALGTLLTNNSLVIVKALAILSCLFAAVSVRRLVWPDKSAMEAAIITLLLPTVIADGPLLGQCDGIWAGLCILSVAAAIEGRLLAMVVWCGLAFAFKAQAAFIAPFVVAILIKDRAPIALWSAPPLIYCAAMFPAWLAGWPATDLATIYVHQAQYFNTIGSAPGAWAIAAALLPYGEPSYTWTGLLAGTMFAGAYIFMICRLSLTREKLLEAALLSSLALPYLLPKMHERFTLLADMLALSLCFMRPGKRSATLATAVIFSSSLAYVGFMAELPWLTVMGCVINTAVLVELVRGLMPQQSFRFGFRIDKRFG